jgi:hypothetical protein
MKEATAQIGISLGDDAFNGDAHLLLVQIYKNQRLPVELRLEAAKAAIGYEKPRLSSVDASIEATLTYAAMPIRVEQRDSDSPVAH